MSHDQIDVERILVKLEELSNKMLSYKEAIFGNDLQDKKGLMDRVGELEEELYGNEKKRVIGMKQLILEANNTIKEVKIIANFTANFIKIFAFLFTSGIIFMIFKFFKTFIY